LPTATTEWVQALESLARHPNGCSEALMLAHGFTVAFLAGLVRGRLVTAELNATHVVWMQITDLGREALARQLRCAALADVRPPKNSVLQFDPLPAPATPTPGRS
jgi:hypothetical protein